jgi:glycine oxidase
MPSHGSDHPGERTGYRRTGWGAVGEYRADRTVIAAGAWSSSLHKGLPRSYPVRGHLLAYHAKPGTLPTILRHGSTYLFQRERAPAEIIAGSSTEDIGFVRAIDPGIVADLKFRAGQLLPALSKLEPFECWNGFRPAIDAAGPAIGPIPGTSVWTAYGHYRNGILLAPETARIVAAGIH